MFQDDIYNVIADDASINQYADHILVKRLPAFDNGDEVNEKEDTIVFINYSKEESERTRDSIDYMSRYALFVYVGSPQSHKMFELSDIIQQTLEVHNSENILNINYVDGNESYDDESYVFYNDMEFEVIYSR